MTTREERKAEERTSQTKAIRLGAWTYECSGTFDSHKAEWGDGWQRYDRAHEPPQVQITISDGMDADMAVSLLTDMLKSVRDFMEAEAKAEARIAQEAARITRLSEELRTMPPDKLALAETLIQQLAGTRQAEDPLDIPF